MNVEMLLTVEEVAERLRLTPGTVRRVIRHGHLQAVRPRTVRRVLIPVSSVRDFLERDEVARGRARSHTND
jgi:excisionase family DNA binding protein